MNISRYNNGTTVIAPFAELGMWEKLEIGLLYMEVQPSRCLRAHLKFQS